MIIPKTSRAFTITQSRAAVFHTVRTGAGAEEPFTPV